MGTDRRVCLGVIIGAKGVRGEVRIKSFTDDPSDVAAYGPVQSKDGRNFEVSVTGDSRGVVTARLKGVADRNAAEALKGTELFVDRAKLPPPATGTYYYTDLIGLRVVLAGGAELGTVTAVDNFGGGDVMQIAGTDGKTGLIPFTPAVIAAVDVAGGKLAINAVPGLLDEGGETEERMRGGDAA